MFTWRVMPRRSAPSGGCIIGVILPIENRKGLHQYVFTWQKMILARRLLMEAPLR
jgi:hypothetical protein